MKQISDSIAAEGFTAFASLPPTVCAMWCWAGNEQLSKVVNKRYWESRENQNRNVIGKKKKEL